MSESPDQKHTVPVPARNLLVRANRAETVAMGFLGLGGLLLMLGTFLAILSGRGLFCFQFGGIALLIGCVENVRAEILRVRAKLENN